MWRGGVLAAVGEAARHSLAVRRRGAARWAGSAGSSGERLDKIGAGRRAEVGQGRAVRGDLAGFVTVSSGKGVQPAANTGHRQCFALCAKSARGSTAVVGFAS